MAVNNLANEAPGKFYLKVCSVYSKLEQNWSEQNGISLKFDKNMSSLKILMCFTLNISHTFKTSHTLESSNLEERFKIHNVYIR